MAQREIYTYAHWKGLKDPFLMGVLRANQSKGKEVFSFEYSKEWLSSGYSQSLDPDLKYFAGQQYVSEGKENFGIFLDSSPDRWGRTLMKRREIVIARKEERKPRTLLETDYLLGVFDGQRMGALRFKDNIEGPFLDDNSRLASPPWTSLRELENASLKLEKDTAFEDPNYLMWLNMLMAPGSSLGGARPKAGVIDVDKHLWIAKFPSGNDDRDIGAWEMVVIDLAKKAGLTVAESMIKKFSKKHHTFLTKRFDRTDTGERIHFASAMTMLGYTDGADAQNGVSYLELVEFLMRCGADINNDLKELWRRIVFNICVSNTDDHLRNHGFLLTDAGWILSPAYDMNPIEDATGLKLNINDDDNSLELDLAMEVAEHFRLDKVKAETIIKSVKDSVKDWRKVAGKYKIPKSEQEVMSKAFLED